MGTISPIQATLRDGRRFVLRTPGCDDAPALLEHARRAVQQTEFNVTMPDEFEGSLEQQHHWIGDHLQQPGFIAILAEPAQAGTITHAVPVIAMVHAENRPTYQRFSHHARIGISVHDDWQNAGLGTHLINALVNWATACEHIHKLTLNVFADNHRAITVYRKLGFTREGTRKYHIRLEDGTYVDDHEMALWVGPPSPRLREISPE